MSHEESVHPNLNGRQAAETTGQPDPEVVPKAERRRHPVEYKLRTPLWGVAEADACTRPGAIGALLRREGLYRSLLDKWRSQRRQGTLQALAPHKRGPKVDAQAAEIARLRRENERLQKRLQQAETIIEVQKNYRCYWACQRTSAENDEQP